MKGLVLVVLFSSVLCAALLQGCSHDAAPFRETESAVARVLSYPGYTRADERTLNRAGDMAALAVMRALPLDSMNRPERAEQVLSILQMAFEAPQLIASKADRSPTAAILLLDHLKNTAYGRGSPTAIENVQFEILHNTTTGKPPEFCPLE